MKKFCESLRKQNTMEITNFKKKNMKSLTKEQEELYENTKFCYNCKKMKINRLTIKIF